MMIFRILRSPEAVEGGGPSGEEEITPDQSEKAPCPEAIDRPKSEPTEADREALLARELADREQQLRDREAAYQSALRDRELAIALAGRPLVPGAGSQLLKLWREELTVIEDGDHCRVASRDGRSVAEAVDDWLSSPEYAHFCQAPSQGGAAIAGTNRPSTTSQSDSSRTLGEAILRRWREAVIERNSSSAPVGLGHRY